MCFFFSCLKSEIIFRGETEEIENLGLMLLFLLYTKTILFGTSFAYIYIENIMHQNEIVSSYYILSCLSYTYFSLGESF